MSYITACGLPLGCALMTWILIGRPFLPFRLERLFSKRLVDMLKTVLRTAPRPLSGKHGEYHDPLGTSDMLMASHLRQQRFGYSCGSCTLGAWQHIVEQFPSCLESQHLQESFKLWGQAKLDRRFESQAEFTCATPPRKRFPTNSEADSEDDTRLPTDVRDDPQDHHSFLIKSIESRPVGSEWTITWCGTSPCLWLS